MSVDVDQPVETTESGTVFITDEEFTDFKTALRAHHAEYAKERRGGITLRVFCVCGYPDSPGPPGCRALTKLLR